MQTSYPGLSEAEALARSKAFGPNALAPIRSRGTARIIVGTLREPMFLLLVVASVLYLLIGNLGEGLFLTLAAAATVGLVVVQEARSERALEALRDLSAPNVRLIRGGTERVASVTTLVPGDIILVGEGQRVPADGRLVLSGILERAAGSGDLDRGLEDIQAEELEVLDQETIRTDVSTGAETALVTFSLKVRREILLSDQALVWADEVAHQLVINEKSGRAAIAELGLTTATDEDRLIAAVRLVRPDDRQTFPEKVFEESAWKPVDDASWRPVWDDEVAATDPWRTRELTLATGLLLPIWGRLPARGCSVRRVRAPDGRRWLGRVLDAAQARTLKSALGLTDVGDAWADCARTGAILLDRSVQLSLEGGLWLKRARVMDRWRIEVVGGRTDRDALVALGCFVEIIAFTPRVFVPVDRPAVVEAVLRRHPVQTVLDGAAA